MQIIQINPEDRRCQKAFINFPFDLYKDTPQWVPPLKIDMRKIFKPSYAFYQYGDAVFLLALSGSGQILGRLAVANNHRYNDFHKSKTAFFYYFETVKDPDVAQALFSHGFDWAHSQGLNRVLGPKGLTVLDGFGMLIKGFQHRPAFGQAYNPPYYPDLINDLGFTKVKDILTGWIDENTEVPEKIAKAAKLVEKRMGYSVPLLKTKADLRKVVGEFQTLYNESLAEPAGNPPITDEDMANMVRQLLWIADPRLVKLIYKDGKAIGWLLVYPDIGAAFQRIKGRLFPFGWLHILLESKRTKWVNMNGIGIIEKYQRLGATSVLYNEFHKSVMESGKYNYAELLQFREDNINSLMEAANVEVNFHKIHRLYEKEI
jgi:hypothetical protein